MKKKTVLMVITNLNYGGAQRVFYQLSLELSKRYHVIEVVFNFEHGHAFKTGNPIYSLDVKGGGSLFRKVINFYLRYKRLADIKKETRADVCISHLEGADYVNISSRQQERVICCIHGSKISDKNIHGLSGWVRRKILIPYLYKKADALVAVSRGIKEEFLTQFGVRETNIHWLPNFFYPDHITELAKGKLPSPWDKLLYDNRITILTAGRLSHQKNLKGLVRLAAHIKRYLAVKWVILGDGELFSGLVSYAKQLNLMVFTIKDDKVDLLNGYDMYFLGYSENPFLWISKADWFILTSDWEGFPMVIGESMACGTPVIATDCQTGPREFLSDTAYPEVPVQTCLVEPYGILIPLLSENLPEDVLESMTAQLKYLLTDKALREKLAESSRQRIENFTPERIMPGWFTLIESD
jgi:glycosyltransferase involved in cell wall biosynthesis